MTTQKTYASFLIRLWRDGSPKLPKPDIEWQGEIQHIQSGQHWTFTTLDELQGFFRRLTEALEVEEGPTTGEDHNYQPPNRGRDHTR